MKLEGREGRKGGRGLVYNDKKHDGVNSFSNNNPGNDPAPCESASLLLLVSLAGDARAPNAPCWICPCMWIVVKWKMLKATL